MTSAFPVGQDYIALLPLIVVGVAAFVVMLAIAFRRDHGLIVGLTFAGLTIAFATIFIAAPVAPRTVEPLLVVDRYALLYQGLLFAASAAVTLLAFGYFGKRGEDREEYYLLLLIATFGGGVLAASDHFASFFLGLEILTVSLYAMIAYNFAKEQSIEAGIKYLVLAGSSAAFLLFGMALIYAETGTLEFTRIAAASSSANPGILFLAGSALLIVGFGFKLAVVPFHLWTPDVYQGAPAPTTALVATVSKGAVLALLFRYFREVGQMPSQLVLVFAIIAVASMIVGNTLALRQDNVKRILAYSSISHLGYLLVAFIAGGQLGASAATFYLVAYFATTLGAFGVVTALSTRECEAEHIDQFRGLAWRRPWLAAAFATCLLSLAGIPLTAGFVGKFLIVTAGVGATQWLLVVTLVVTSTVGLVYYLRVATALFSRAVEEDAAASPSLAWPTGVALVILAALVLGLGLYPTPIVEVIQASLGLTS